MSGWLVAGVGIVYAYIAFEQYFKGNTAMAITFGGYAVSNIGLYLATK